jgi:hypothetical protein
MDYNKNTRFLFSTAHSVDVRVMSDNYTMKSRVKFTDPLIIYYLVAATNLRTMALGALLRRIDGRDQIVVWLFVGLRHYQIFGYEPRDSFL